MTPGPASGATASAAVLLTGIAELVTCAGPDGATTTDDLAASATDRLGVVTDAAVVVLDGRVAWVGPAVGAPPADRVVDLGGRAVVPGFVDSHSHLVYAVVRTPRLPAGHAARPGAGSEPR